MALPLRGVIVRVARQVPALMPRMPVVVAWQTLRVDTVAETFAPRGTLMSKPLASAASLIVRLAVRLGRFLAAVARAAPGLLPLALEAEERFLTSNFGAENEMSLIVRTWPSVPLPSAVHGDHRR